MTINKTITAITFVTLLASGSAFANPDGETDVLYGGAQVSVSQSELPDARSLSVNDQHGDQLYDRDTAPSASALSPFERISANPDISTDMLYGS